MAVSTATAATASSTALGANARRIYASITNTDSSEWAFLNFGAAAEANKGRGLAPKETFVIEPHGVHEVWARGEITCIRGGASDVTLSVFEVEE